MFWPAERHNQDGTEAVTAEETPAALPPLMRDPRAPSQHGPMSPPQPSSGLPALPPGTPINKSPAKARMRLDSPASDSHEVSQQSLSQNLPRDQLDSKNSYPTMGQTVLDTTLKEMLMSLRSSLQADMPSLMHTFGHNINVLEDRVSHFEGNLGE